MIKINVKVLIILLLFSNPIFSAVFTDYSFESVKEFKGRNKKGKNSHTIINKTGVTRTIYIGLDVETMLLFPEKIDTIDIPGRDITQYEPDPNRDDIENNFVIKVVDPETALNGTFKLVGNVITVKGIVYALKFIVVRGKDANHHIYLFDGVSQKKDKSKYSKKNFLQMERKLNSIINQSQEVLSKILFNDGYKVDKSPSYDGVELTLNTISRYSNNILFNLESSNRKLIPLKTKNITFSFSEIKKYGIVETVLGSVTLPFRKIKIIN